MHTTRTNRSTAATVPDDRSAAGIEAPETDGRIGRFSVIIPTYNRSDLLQRAVESVVRQNLADTQIIVVDDGSTDQAAQHSLERILAEPRVQCVRQENCGAAAARNRGAVDAEGDYLVFLDSDDELLPGSLCRFAGALNGSGAGVVSGAAILVGADGEPWRFRSPENLGPAFANQVGLFLAGTFAIERTLFHQIGGFAEACRSSQHTELALRLAPHCRRAGKILAAIDEPCVRIHAHGDSHLRGNLQTLLDGALYVINTHERQLKQSPRYHADWCTIAAVYAAKLGNYATARRLLCKALKSNHGRAANYARLALACVPPLARRVWTGES